MIPRRLVILAIGVLLHALIVPTPLHAQTGADGGGIDHPAGRVGEASPAGLTRSCIGVMTRSWHDGGYETREA